MILFNEGFQNQIDALSFDLNRPSNRLDDMAKAIESQSQSNSRTYTMVENQKGVENANRGNEKGST